jgi:hypothetical protein
LEFAAVVHALKIWRHYLIGNKREIYTEPEVYLNLIRSKPQAKKMVRAGQGL